jgi:hypothetical protein
MTHENEVFISKQFLDLNAFFTALEKAQRELQQKGIPTIVPVVAKDELGWYVTIRIRPDTKY